MVRGPGLIPGVPLRAIFEKGGARLLLLSFPYKLHHLNQEIAPFFLGTEGFARLAPGLAYVFNFKILRSPFLFLRSVIFRFLQRSSPVPFPCLGQWL